MTRLATPAVTQNRSDTREGVRAAAREPTRLHGCCARRALIYTKHRKPEASAWSRFNRAGTDFMATHRFLHAVLDAGLLTALGLLGLAMIVVNTGNGGGS